MVEVAEDNKKKEKKGKKGEKKKGDAKKEEKKSQRRDWTHDRPPILQSMSLPLNYAYVFIIAIANLIIIDVPPTYHVHVRRVSQGFYPKLKVL